MTDVDAQLDAAFAALAHPARRQILASLAKGEATVTDLAEPFDISLPAVSNHIRVLEKAGLITRGRNAQFRPCRMNFDRLKVVVDWSEAYRQIWEARFDRMDSIIEAKREESDDGR